MLIFMSTCKCYRSNYTQHIFFYTWNESVYKEQSYLMVHIFIRLDLILKISTFIKMNLHLDICSAKHVIKRVFFYYTCIQC